MEEISIVAKLFVWGKQFFTNKYVLIALAVLAISGGTYLYIHHDINKQVATKVEQHDDKATIQTLQTKDQAVTASRAIDNKYDALAIKTAKDYDHVRSTVTSPVVLQSADAPLDPLLLDTFNQLAGLHGNGAAANGVSNSAD